ncbi:hypothetical protein A2634_00165 [Candidatus Amesbacteria bacterium RIFCSPHIGHO2_01_FULL_48_32]|nr:MAG: hypothetical protein A2634_00165 [Candidatus Amesbacteria bacterium RIFCSPHIGHO2_01_FULL_48_32]HJZ05166.1 hypothetical protein [Patescibacteria group bacterium]
MEEYMTNFRSRLKLLTAMGVASYMICAEGLYLLGPNVIVPLATVSGGIYILGTILDLSSTKTGLGLGARELNPILPQKPSPQELHGIRALIGDGFSLVLGMLLPPVGMTVGVDRLRLAFDNFKKIKAHKKSVKG